MTVKKIKEGQESGMCSRCAENVRVHIVLFCEHKGDKAGRQSCLSMQRKKVVREVIDLGLLYCW